MERLWDNVDASLECLPGDVLSYVFEFLVSGLEEVASLARVSRFFQICVKRPNVVRWLQLSTHARLRQTSSWDKEAASAQLVATLRQVRSGCPSITGVNLGCMFETFDDIQYVTNEHVRMVAAFPKLERVSLSQCAAVTKVRPLQSLETLTYLNLQNCTSIPKAGFACLSSLVSLQDLNVRYTGINDKGLRALSTSLTALTNLDLFRCKSIVRGATFASLSSLTSLTRLDLADTVINNEGLEELSESLAVLTNLNLSWCTRISGAGFTCLSSLMSLQKLGVIGTAFNDEGIEALTMSLIKLDLQSCASISGRGFASLASLTSLHELNIRETNITGNGLEVLSASLTALVKLNLSGCWLVLGSGFACLSSLTSLRELNIRSTTINDGVLEGLSSSLTRLVSLDLSWCSSITTPGFFCLSSLASLQELDLRETSINARDFASLKRSLPTLAKALPATEDFIYEQ